MKRWPTPKLPSIRPGKPLHLAHLAHLAAFLLLVLAPWAARAASPRVDFNREIRPILSDKCFACHGPDDKQRKARLRFDVRADAVQPAKSGATAIVPGKPEASELVKRLVTADADEQMPPVKFGKTVTPQQVELLKRWIAEGAEFHEHWSFIPPQRSPVPKATAPSNPPAKDAAANPGPADRANPIDGFVRARLAQEGLEPSPEADPTTLVRRLTLDLTGLPPSPEEVDALIFSSSSQAYEDLVDRLLASPRYGERMAVEWLDAARYADTHGYHLDSGRDMTPWRDGVIRAFNENQPFDQFTIEQLAGDLLPNATRDQKIASGFNRNHMINYEGGAIPEEYQYAYLVDRVNTTSATWLGLSMSCAQCHDHKYDPLTRTDFYRLLAFFNNVPENGLDGNRGNAAPTLRLPTPEQEARLAELDQQRTAAEQRLAGPLPEIDAAQAKWESTVGTQPQVDWKVVTPINIRSEAGSAFQILNDQSVRVTGANPSSDAYAITLDNASPRLTALRLEAMADEALPNHGPGRAGNGNFVLSSVRVATGGTPVRLKSATADHSQNGYPVTAVLDDSPTTGWAVDGALGNSHAAVLEFETPPPPGPTTVTLAFQSGFSQHAIGRFRLAFTEAASPQEIRSVPPEIRNLIAKAPPDRTPEDAAKLRSYYRDHVSSDFGKLKGHLATLKKQREELEASVPSTMVMGELAQPRDTFMRIRGQYDKLGDKVTAGTPAALPSLPAGEPPNRLGLARWLVSPNHPLTARVIVNRYWQMYFGTGIVRTAEDFGSQGEWPSHPELLDWLAREFIESGWNVKHLQRLIVTSATYRQSSRVTPERLQKDPENRLLSRGPRFRLQAEFIRDQALAVSGLLNPQIGGKSVSPYQPAGLWEELSMREDSRNFSAQFFVQSKGPDLYRRSMYTFWKRSSPPPQMSTFDAPDRETCTVRRPRTNTPLQALVLLNDPTYIEASRKLAERLLGRAGSDADRVQWGFRLTTARFPNPAESAVLLRVLEQQRAHYRAQRDAADHLLSNGEATRDLTLDAAELAAWTMLSSTLLNLDETVTKG